MFLVGLTSCNSISEGKKSNIKSGNVISGGPELTDAGTKSDYIIIVSPGHPSQGEDFRIIAAGSSRLNQATLEVRGSSGILKPAGRESGEGIPGWIIEEYKGTSEGKYQAELTINNKVVGDLGFGITVEKKLIPSGIVWKTIKGWDCRGELLYSAWINSLFHGCDEQASWTSLNEVTQNRTRNFLYNYLSLDEDNPDGKVKVVMQPDCADNPFFLRAYFSWKMGLPFGYHITDRGSLNRCPATGQWITNELPASQANQVLAFNSFLRRVMDGVQSGTARTALDNETSDYYPVPLDRISLRPGTVYADPYGHTLVLVGWVPQTGRRSGILLAVDAQPDGTIGIKRFWKGNFLFNTTGVIGEPGFKAFRPVALQNGKLQQVKNSELKPSEGFVQFSLDQRKMKSDLFYHTMERLINPEPLDPETEMVYLIQALYEQLLVRVTSVANGEAYLKSHPGSVISMPSGAAAIFQAGGQWEAYSTPNRDLRLLIAMDEVLGFPEKVAGSPEDFNISRLSSPDKVRKKLQEILERKTSELTITYTRTDGSSQKLTVREILDRIEAFEVAYNPNDGIEIRWGAPEKSEEMSTCRRHAPAYQVQTMQRVRKWFRERSHPPT